MFAENVVTIWFTTFLIISMVHASTNRGFITQEQLEKSSSHLDFNSINKIEVKSWNSNRNVRSYGKEIHERFVLNEDFRHINRLSGDGKRRTVAETRLNQLAEIMYRSKGPLSGNKKVEWNELKKALRKTYGKSESIILYNEIRKDWTVCAWVQNWYNSKSKPLQEILRNAPASLRVCSAQSLLGVPKITRKPVVLLDYIPAKYMERYTKNRDGFPATKLTVTTNRQDDDDDDGDTVTFDFFGEPDGLPEYCLSPNTNPNCIASCCSNFNSNSPLCDETAMNCFVSTSG